jgi:THAP domain
MRHLTLDGKPWTPSDDDRLCSKHFANDMFDRTGETVRLKPDTVPKIFELPNLNKVSYVVLKRYQQYHVGFPIVAFDHYMVLHYGLYF